MRSYLSAVRQSQLLFLCSERLKLQKRHLCYLCSEKLKLHERPHHKVGSPFTLSLSYTVTVVTYVHMYYIPSLNLFAANLESLNTNAGKLNLLPSKSNTFILSLKKYNCTYKVSNIFDRIACPRISTYISNTKHEE